LPSELTSATVNFARFSRNVLDPVVSQTDWEKESPSALGSRSSI